MLLVWQGSWQHMLSRSSATSHPDVAVAQEDLVDADTLLALTGELRTLRTRLDEADVSDEQRQRWQRTMGAIAEGATTDLDRARAQLRRLTAQVDRVAGA